MNAVTPKSSREERSLSSPPPRLGSRSVSDLSPTKPSGDFLAQLKARVEKQREENKEEPPLQKARSFSFFVKDPKNALAWKQIYASPLVQNADKFAKVSALAKQEKGKQHEKGVIDILTSFESAKLLLDSSSAHSIENAVNSCLNDTTLGRLNMTLDKLQEILALIQKKWEI